MSEIVVLFDFFQTDDLFVRIPLLVQLGTDDYLSGEWFVTLKTVVALVAVEVVDVVAGTLHQVFVGVHHLLAHTHVQMRWLKILVFLVVELSNYNNNTDTHRFYH